MKPYFIVALLLSFVPISGVQSMEINISEKEYLSLINDYVRNEKRFDNYLFYLNKNINKNQKYIEIYGVCSKEYNDREILTSGYGESDIVFIIDTHSKKIIKIIKYFVDEEIDRVAKDIVIKDISSIVNVENISILPYYYDINSNNVVYYIESNSEYIDNIIFNNKFYCFASIDMNNKNKVEFGSVTIPMPDKILKSRSEKMNIK